MFLVQVLSHAFEIFSEKSGEIHKIFQYNIVGHTPVNTWRSIYTSSQYRLYTCHTRVGGYKPNMASQTETSSLDNNKRPIPTDFETAELECQPTNKFAKVGGGEAVPCPEVHDEETVTYNMFETQSATFYTPTGGGRPQKSGRPRLSLAVLQNDIRELKTDFDNKCDSIHKSNENMQMKIDTMKDDIVAGINESLSEKISHIVREEVQRIRKSFEQQMQGLCVRLRAIEETQEVVNTRVTAVEETCDLLNERRDQQEVRDLNIVVFGLPFSEAGNVKNKVDAVLKDGLKLRNVSVEHAIRKPSNKPNKPGIVIAKCRNKEDKNAIMKNKRKLKDSVQFKKVMIAADKPAEQRITENNMRTLANALRDKVTIKGTRITMKSETNAAGDGTSRGGR